MYSLEHVETGLDGRDSGEWTAAATASKNLTKKKGGIVAKLILSAFHGGMRHFLRVLRLAIQHSACGFIACRC